MIRISTFLKAVVLSLVRGTELLSIIHVFSKPFIIGKIKYDFIKTYAHNILCSKNKKYILFFCSKNNQQNTI